jgi:hypothetical protein
MVRIAFGLVAVATVTAGILLRRRNIRPAFVTNDDLEFDVDDLYEAGL